MSPRQVVAALTGRTTAAERDELEQWVDGLRDTTTGPIDTDAVRALADTDTTREEQS